MVFEKGSHKRPRSRTGSLDVLDTWYPLYSNGSEPIRWVSHSWTLCRAEVMGLTYPSAACMTSRISSD